MPRIILPNGESFSGPDATKAIAAWKGSLPMSAADTIPVFIRARLPAIRGTGKIPGRVPDSLGDDHEGFLRVLARSGLAKVEWSGAGGGKGPVAGLGFAGLSFGAVFGSAPPGPFGDAEPLTHHAAIPPLAQWQRLSGSLVTDLQGGRSYQLIRFADGWVAQAGWGRDDWRNLSANGRQTHQIDPARGFRHQSAKLALDSVTQHARS